MKTWVVLVDCNNFFASCEKLFRPDWVDRPLVVLSNNDGCVIARSAEVKALGTIPMGIPYFKIRNQVKRHHIVVCSCNHEFYADISRRVSSVLRTFSPYQEVYSVDESFLVIQGTRDELLDIGGKIRERVGKWVGVPVSVGIAETKTLAKLAVEPAKKIREHNGVFLLETGSDSARQVMAGIPVNDVWGVGRRLAPALKQLGIADAYAMSVAPADLIRRKFGVTVERIVREMQGYRCHDSLEEVEARKQILCSRSFGEKVKTFEQMRESVCMHAERAGFKLRREGRLCATIAVFARALFGVDNGKPVYENIHAFGTFDYPTADTRQLIGKAAALIGCAWRPGLTYCNSGVVLSDFSDPAEGVQLSFDTALDAPHDRKLMEILDQLHMNGHSVHFAGQGLRKPWGVRTDMLSPRYTTRWKDLPEAGGRDERS